MSKTIAMTAVALLLSINAQSVSAQWIYESGSSHRSFDDATKRDVNGKVGNDLVNGSNAKVGND